MNTKTVLAISLSVICFFAMNAAFSAPVTEETEVSRESFVNGPQGDKDYNADDKKFHEPENPLTTEKVRLPTASPSKKRDQSIRFKDSNNAVEALKETKGFEPVKYDFEMELDPLG